MSDPRTSPTLTPKARALLVALRQRPHFAVMKAYKLRGFAPRGGAMVLLSAVKNLHERGLVALGTIDGHSAAVLTASGARAAAAIDAGHRPRARRKPRAGEERQLAWWQQ